MSNNDDDALVPRNKNQSFNTTINVAHILTTLGAIAYIFNGVAEIKTTIATNMTEIAHLKEERAREAGELKESIKELDKKVSRLIERGLR
jgi:hypothetical protein